jgi:hypothetical protein
MQSLDFFSRRLKGRDPRYNVLSVLQSKQRCTKLFELLIHSDRSATYEPLSSPLKYFFPLPTVGVESEQCERSRLCSSQYEGESNVYWQREYSTTSSARLDREKTAFSLHPYERARLAPEFELK